MPPGTPERAKAGARTPRPSLSATGPGPDSGPHTPNGRTASSVSSTKTAAETDSAAAVVRTIPADY